MAQGVCLAHLSPNLVPIGADDEDELPISKEVMNLHGRTRRGEERREGKRREGKGREEKGRERNGRIGRIGKGME